MTNKIGSGGVDNRPVQLSSESGVKRTKSATDANTAVAAKPASSNEGVRITDSARQLAALEQAIRTLPDVDQAKVAQIRSSIEAGTYQVSPNRIAEKLIRMEKELTNIG